MQSLSLVMSECFLSGRGQGHLSNFDIVDSENFATANRRYTGNIHNSTVVCLFMTHCFQLTSNFIPSVWSGLVVLVVSTLLRGNGQDYY